MSQHETTAEFLARVQGYCDAATDGPWFHKMHQGNGPEEVESNVVNEAMKVLVAECGAYELEGDIQPEYDGRFIAQSRTDLPRLVRALEYAMSRLNDANPTYDDEGELSLTMAHIRNGEEVDDG